MLSNLLFEGMIYLYMYFPNDNVDITPIFIKKRLTLTVTVKYLAIFYPTRFCFGRSKYNYELWIDYIVTSISFFVVRPHYNSFIIFL